MTTDSKKKGTHKATDIVGYLEAHPDFFLKNPQALTALELKHDTGSAVSLIEQQVKHLRNINQRLQSDLQHLVRVARDNDRISEASHQLSLEIIQADSEDAILLEVKKQMRDTFNVDFCEILSIATLDENVLSDLKQKLNSDNIFLGRLSEKCHTGILGKDADKVKSVACVYLKMADGDRLLVLGSKDNDRYQESVGTHFLLQLGDLIIISLHQKNHVKSH